MSRPTLYVAITNHGFGHATRTATILAEIQRQCPEVLLILVTNAPRWLLETYLTGDFIYRPRTLDVGVIQTDSLTLDLSTTLEQLQQLQATQDQLIAAEVTFIRQNQVDLVLADIPPLAAKIAEAADLPCWMWSNFGWDLIYAEWGAEFESIVEWIQTCFQGCDRLFRLPFHEPMPAFRAIEDVGLTGTEPRFPLTDLQAKLGIDPKPEQTLLLTFGGLGLADIPYHNLSRFPDWQFLTFAGSAPDHYPNLIKITAPNIRPLDVMPLCTRVISKPGYSTFAEACYLDVPVISIPRSDFAEARYLLAGLQDHNHHQLLAPGEFTDSNWAFLEQPLLPPRQTTPLLKNGKQVIAQAVIDFLSYI